MIKNKNSLEQLSEAVSDVIYKLGIVLMSAATVTGMMELPNFQDVKIALVSEPVISVAGGGTPTDNPLRREKESTETNTVHASYRAVQRTPARSIGIK